MCYECVYALVGNSVGMNFIINYMHKLWLTWDDLRFDECAPTVQLVELYGCGEYNSIVPLLLSQVGKPRLCPATL